jgi:hypothetical protein
MGQSLAQVIVATVIPRSSPIRQMVAPE